MGGARVCDSVGDMSTQRAGAETTREEVVNVILAELLRERGLAARAERRTRRNRPDIKVSLPSRDQLIVECKWETSRRDLERQLDERLTEFPEAIAVIGVLYPSRLRLAEDTGEALESAEDLEWWVHGSRGVPQALRPMRHGSVNEFADHIPSVPLEIEGVDRVVAAATAVGYALEQVAGQIRGHARVSSQIAGIIAESDQETDQLAAVKIAALVLFNALAFQHRLAAIDDRVPTVAEALAHGNTGLQEAWSKICDAIDYVPVFELATRILKQLDFAPEEKSRAVINLLNWAVRSTRDVEGHDLSGRLFHTLLTDAKFKGTYYTSVPAATMLTHLVFHNWPRNVNWADETFPSLLNVADLACGTGTLLLAVASEAERRHEQAGGKNRDRLHKNMVELALHGYDVQLSAIHFAATSLAMLNPRIESNHMNMWVMPLGVAENGDVSLGSLDFLLDANETPAQYSLSSETDSGGATRGPEHVSGERRRPSGPGGMARLPTLDLAIMNPPFTRSAPGNLLFGSLPEAERRIMQDELQRRLKTRQASATAGLGAAFVATATPNLRPGEGRLALVLPLTVCTGPSWAQTRALIEQDFYLDMVISSHDPQRWNFSDSTDLSEALLIATRRPIVPPRTGEATATGDTELDRHRTTFVNLWRNPDSVIDAHLIARAIARTPPAELEGTGTSPVTVGGEHVGELISMRQSKFAGGKWSGIQFARADVTRSALQLLQENKVWIPGSSPSLALPLIPLRQIGQVGPDSRRLDDGFDRTSSVTAFPLVDGHDTDTRKSLSCSPNSHLMPLPKPRGAHSTGYGAHLWQQAANLLISARYRSNTARVVSMRVDTPVLGRMWWPVKLDNVTAEKALCLWLNSSLGVLTLLSVRNTTMGAWVQSKKADIEALPVLDVRALSEEKLDALSALFDVVSEMEFERLPAMAECPARRTLDDGLSRILNLPDLEPLRRLLATEPVVSNRRL